MLVLPDEVTMGVTVKAWGVANSLTGFTTLSFCELYLSIIFMIDRLGVSGRKQASLIRRELSAVFLIPLFFPIVLTILLIARTQLLFGETIFRCKGTCPLKEPALYLIHTYVAVFQLPLD